MCGICGVIRKREIESEFLKKMNDEMSHRGPDDSGIKIFTDNGNHIGLAQRRLAVQDLSPLGHQPMCTPDESVWIVFNGEIYNFMELREEVQDYPFVSRCDTEVILAMYQKYGMKCLKKFNGMFAIAIYDRRKNALYLARDRMGKKPLYYYMNNGEFLFASELKPFLPILAFRKKLTIRC